VAVTAAEADVRPLLGPGVDIAAVNGPSSVVVSGEREAVADIVSRLVERGVRTRGLRVSHAFHSPLMEPMLDRYREVLESVEYAAPRVSVVSGVSGAVASVEELCSPEYWVRQVREAVRFADGVRTLADMGVRTALELGPDAVLSALARECLAAEGADDFGGEDGVVFASALRRERGEEAELLGAVATAYTRGAAVDWPALFAGRGARRVDLPTYPFQRKTYWLNATTVTGDAAGFGQQRSTHPLLTAVVDLGGTDNGTVLTGRLSLTTQPWLAEHTVSGVVMLPGTSFVDMAVHAAALVGCAGVGELMHQAPLVVPESGGVALQAVVSAPDEQGRRTVEFYSRPDDASDDTPGDLPWTLHTSGTLVPEPAPARTDRADGVWPPAGAERVELEGFYEGLAAEGYAYGPLFQGLKSAWRAGGDLCVEVELPSASRDQAAAFGVHPALLDAVLHATEFVGDDTREDGEVWLPFVWGGVVLRATGASVVRARVRS
ncbi:type I polyketide synthase, partial [Streptomyces sp. M2CJ-2]|uniref:acyltransferase domain-containing protein n=1 Tax=Streptomyces sp. M2CJ-2 TaxID=2803948 RepID=UPI0019292478